MRSFLSVFLLSLSFVVGLAACDSTPDPRFQPAEDCDDGELAVETLEEGSSPSTVRSTSVVVASYVGTLVATRDTFDASPRATLALSGTATRPPSIAGFRQGLTGTVVGDSLRLTIPPDLAYGGRDVIRNGEVSIPACSVIQFHVRVLDIFG